ncbi:MAG: hypothetical protein JNL97_04475, partial [Verrucomicrobiales bacterium]|nr:hypothetical protein [Verrucomicrobiales bacterium]
RLVGDDKQAALDQIGEKVTPLQSKEQQLTSATGALKKAQEDANYYREWLQAKYRWVDIMTELRAAMLAAEEKAKPPGVDVGIWIESMKMGNVVKEFADTQEAPAEEEAKPMTFAMSPELMRRYGLIPSTPQPTEGEGGGDAASGDGSGGGDGSAAPAASTTKKKKSGSTNEVSEISLVFRAVNLANLSPTNNLHISASVEQELRSNPLFDPENTRLGKQPTPEEGAPTFTFELTLGLKTPITL